MMKDGTVFRVVESNCWSLEDRIKDMDATGTDGVCACWVVGGVVGVGGKSEWGVALMFGGDRRCNVRTADWA